MMGQIFFLEQQSWLGGAQRVLETTLLSIEGEYSPVVVFPDEGSFRASLDQRGIETLTAPIGRYRTGRKSFLESLELVGKSLYCGLKLAWIVRKRPIVLFYVNGPRWLLAGVIASWLTGRPVVFHLHLILTRRPDLIFVTRLSRYVARVIACSKAAARPVIAIAPQISSRMEVLYNPLQWPDERLPLSSIRPNRSSEDLVFLGVVGRVTRQKGHHVLLRAIGRLPYHLKRRVRLIVVGEGAPNSGEDLEYGRSLRVDARGLGLEEQVEWLGYREDVRSLHGQMDVLVHPALAEAMCIAILEALGSGVPVIASRTGGIPEVVRDGVNGVLVTPNDEDALSQALLTFIGDIDVRKRLQAGARTGLDRRFSFAVFRSEIRRVISQVVSREQSNPEAHTERVRLHR